MSEGAILSPVEPSLGDEPRSEQDYAVVFSGSKSLCQEFSLVLEARGIVHELLESDRHWTLRVAPHVLLQAYDEIHRYSLERSVPRSKALVIEPFPGTSIGVSLYVFILIVIAYCAGRQLLGADWLALGDLSGGAVHEWWRAVTALTLHLDQEHLLGNLLFGAVAGAAAGRLLGPGVAWASVLAAAAAANYCEVLILPATYRAVGASTAVFAALGLLTGMAWRRRLSQRERLWYRWAPLIAGICLLALFGAGNAHVDVLGHALGFLFGLGIGWVYARQDFPRNRSQRLQFMTGVGAILIVCAAWLVALFAGA
jgi:rhomboid protease GluP